MASSSLHLLLFFLLPAFTFASSPADYYKLKSLNFTLYQVDTLNQTYSMIYPGVPGVSSSATSTEAAPFGSMFVFQTPLTVAPSKTSMAVGMTEEISIISSMDGLSNINIAKISLHGYKGLKGSISVVGVANNLQPSEAPVSGGTGDLLFVQGYLTFGFFSNQGLTTTYKIDFHLFWPPYAPFAMKG